MIGSDSINPAELARQAEKELIQNILPYWMEKMVDHGNGGFYGRRDGHDVLHEQADKGVILNTRILWTFSHAVNVLQKKGGVDSKSIQSYQAIADRSYQYVVEKFIDKEKGGVFWMLDYLGKPVNTKKQIYAQAFAIYALSEYFKSSENQEALVHAVDLFKSTEKFSFDKKNNGYFEAFDKDWVLLEDLRLSDKDVNEKKTMNTHLHILEAYTNLYRFWKDDELKKQLRNLVIIFRDKILDNRNHFQLFFNEEWKVKPHYISYGHDIEGSWLLVEAAEVLGEVSLTEEIKNISVKMVDQTLAEGMDSDGGLMNEGNESGVIDSDKHWWPQAEALVGLLSAWQVTGEERYFEGGNKVWSFIQTKLIDREHKEWHWMVRRNGEINYNEDKAGPWKCPYHNGRAMLEIISRFSSGRGI